MTAPLKSRDDAFKHVLAGGDPGAEDAWQAMICRPIGQAITEAVGNDLVRGVMATDALIGTFARVDDPSLLQNVCFLYHLLGGGTGEWDVPIGGMGAVSGALAAAAAGHGAEIITGAEVYAIDPDGEVRYTLDGGEHRVRAEHVLAGVTPAVLAELVGDPEPPVGARRAGEGQPAAATAATAAGRNRHPRAGFRRHVPHQRDVQPARRRVRAGGRAAPSPTRCPARSTAIR